jgi:uncharacterized protein YbjT (DUF2867 family)
MPIALTTPTGQIGSNVVRKLLDAGRTDLVLLVRDATTVHEGTQQDAAFVAHATQGADALFWVSPPDPSTDDVFAWYEGLGRAAAGAVQANGIGRVVHVSSEGAHDTDAYGPVSGLGRIERMLDATDAAVRHLRPTFFMENFKAQLGAIQGAGSVFFPVPPTTTTGMIATADIAEVAARLLATEWSGREVLGLHGPRDLSYADAAAILADALGRDVTAQQVPPDAVREQMAGMGATPAWQQGFVDLYTSIGSGGYRAEARTDATTTPTSLEAWSRTTLVPLVQNG